MSEWVEPDLGKKYVLCDDDGNALAVCTYLDMVAELDPDDWPDSQERYDDLMVAYGAHELSE